MAQYLTKSILTPQGWAAYIANPTNRFEGLKPAFESIGSKLLNVWIGVDQPAVYALSETTEDTTRLLALMMAVLGTGVTASVEGTRLVPAVEAVDAMKQASKVGYRPPVGKRASAKK